jgi:hypothetical protein
MMLDLSTAVCANNEPAGSSAVPTANEHNTDMQDVHAKTGHLWSARMQAWGHEHEQPCHFFSLTDTTASASAIFFTMSSHAMTDMNVMEHEHE